MPIIGHCWKKQKSDIVKTRKACLHGYQTVILRKNEYEEVIMEIFSVNDEKFRKYGKFGITLNAQN